MTQRTDESYWSLRVQGLGKSLSFKGHPAYELAKKNKDFLNTYFREDYYPTIGLSSSDWSLNVGAPKWMAGIANYSLNPDRLLLAALVDAPLNLFKNETESQQGLYNSMSALGNKGYKADVSNYIDFLYVLYFFYKASDSYFYTNKVREYLYHNFLKAPLKAWFSQNQTEVINASNSEVYQLILKHIEEGNKVIEHWLENKEAIYREDPFEYMKTIYLNGGDLLQNAIDPWTKYEDYVREGNVWSLFSFVIFLNHTTTEGEENSPKRINEYLSNIGFNQQFKTESNESPSLQDIAGASIMEGADDLTNAYNSVARESGVQTIDLKSDPAKITELIQCFLVNKIGRELPIQNTKQNFIFPPWYFKIDAEENEGEGNYRALPPHFISTKEDDGLLNKLILNKYWGLGGVSRDFMNSNKKATLNSRLYWIYRDDEGNLQQTRIFLNKNNMKSNYYKADNQDLWETITNNNIFKRDEFNIDSIDIVYEGTNPSTARKDVQVTMTFKVSSLDTLKCPISEPIQFGENTEVLELFHLVTLPNTGKISKNKSLEAKNKTDINEYDPSFSRVRLHVFKDELKDNEANSIIVDLTTIDHSISRDSNTGSTLFTINYRGYFETNYSMPKNDILSTAELRSQRKQIKEKISELKSLGACKEVHLNAAKQLEQQWIDNNVSKNKVSTIINKLISEGKAYKALINKSQLISSAKGIFRADGNTNIRYFIEKVSTDNTIQATTDKDLEEALNPQSEENVDSRSKIGIGGVYTSTFCALGDLLDVVTSGVLTNDGGALENLTAIFGNIRVDDDRIVKPLDLPVDLGAFAKWFDDNVTSKDLSFYPAVTFLRSFLIGFIDRYLGLECNKGSDSRAPNYRFMFHTTSRTTPLTLDFAESGITSTNLYIPDSDSPLLPRMPQAKIGETRDYIIFYQQTNASFVQKKFNEDPHTPCIVYGTKNTRYNSLSDVSLSKNSAPYLREARYFNNDYGSLSLLANVYDLDFMFKDRNANTFFYPGVVFEFILNDWGNTMREDPLIQLETNSKDYEIFGDSNPHKSGTISNILGLGGYYIVKKVEYNLGNTNQDYTIKVSSKFIGSNHQPVIGRKKTENAENSDEQCSDILEEIRNISNMSSNTSEPNVEDSELTEEQQMLIKLGLLEE